MGPERTISPISFAVPFQSGTYVSYGIRAVLASGKEAASVSDVSPDFAFVQRLADLCTLEQLSPIHLHDVEGNSEDNVGIQMLNRTFVEMDSQTWINDV